MRSFPNDFQDLLSAEGRKLFAAAAAKRNAKPSKFTLVDSVMDPRTAAECVRLLDRRLHQHLRLMVRRIPPDSISSMTKNYAELLPKTAHMKTCFLQSRRYSEYAAAEEIGLVSMLQSDCLRRYAEYATGHRLTGGTSQAICYEHGDYAGPHNDHHPQNEGVRDGFVDLHIMFGNDGVDHQWLVYEDRGHLRNICDINLQGGIAVYRLPFWHYTTPLAAKPGRIRSARRWLLLVSYDIVFS